MNTPPACQKCSNSQPSDLDTAEALGRFGDNKEPWLLARCWRWDNSSTITTTCPDQLRREGEEEQGEHGDNADHDHDKEDSGQAGKVLATRVAHGMVTWQPD